MENILARANAIVNERSEEKDRQYGSFEICMKRAQAIYNAMSPEDQSLEVEGIYKVMIAMKLAREGNRHKEDNLLDACAYIGALNNFEESKPQGPCYTEPKTAGYAVVNADGSIDTRPLFATRSAAANAASAVNAKSIVRVEFYTLT